MLQYQGLAGILGRVPSMRGKFPTGGAVLGAFGGFWWGECGGGQGMIVGESAAQWGGGS